MGFMKNNKIFYIVIILILLFSIPASANVPIGAGLFIFYPTAVSFSTYGLGLLCVILIESLILRKWMTISSFRSIILSAEANIFSTLIGVFIAAAYSSGFLLLILFLPGVFLFTHFGLKYFDKKLESFKHENSKIIYLVFFLFFFLLSAFCIFLSSVLMPYELIKIDNSAQVPSTLTTIVIMLLLVAGGFIISIITEGYYLLKKKYIKPEFIIPATFQMNVFSYLALIITTGFFKYYNFIDIAK